MDKMVIREAEVSGLESGLRNTSSLLENMTRLDLSAHDLGSDVCNALSDFSQGLDQHRQHITENTTGMADYLKRF